MVMAKIFECLICGNTVYESDIYTHKAVHPGLKSYGYMWPSYYEENPNRNLRLAPIHQSTLFAEAIGVSEVYIRDEGQNLSGSMKDYIVEEAVNLGIADGANVFTVVSSGNQAFSLAKYTQLAGKKAVLFAPESSSKIGILSTLDNVFILAVKDAIFEDVYRLAADLNLPGVYNANVTNDLLLPGLVTVSRQIIEAGLNIDYVLSGVGNGTYLAGLTLGFMKYRYALPKIIPVGMMGAFPTQVALENGISCYEYQDFQVDESIIDAAEGSIAIASYSMPQLIHAITVSNGFCLGDLLNSDLATAYDLLYQDKALVDAGAIPEPTGIMGLAAAIKYRNCFGSKSRLLISFTGHGVKDLEGIKRLVPNLYDELSAAALASRPDLSVSFAEMDMSKIKLIDKEMSKTDIESIVYNWLRKEGGNL